MCFISQTKVTSDSSAYVIEQAISVVTNQNISGENVSQIADILDNTSHMQFSDSNKVLVKKIIHLAGLVKGLSTNVLEDARTINSSLNR